VEMATRAGGHLAYFSLQGDSLPEALREHIAEGGMAVARSRRWTDEIVLYDRGRRERLVAVSEMPSALGGAAQFNIANAMAAALMAYGHGIPLEAIRAGLSSFSNSYRDNPGRLNICDDQGFRVVIDYGHNQASLRAIGALVAEMEASHGHRIGMVSMPGDRRDDDLREMGAIAAGIFDQLIFRETPDQRGRAPGRINDLMTEGALAAGFPREGIFGIIDEFEAVDFCLSTARPNDLVVLMATSFDEVWQRVKDFRRAPVQSPSFPAEQECNIAIGH
jgi:cyanophycin synthetase